MRALLMSDLPKIGRMWLDGCDTTDIADRLELSESDVHNALPEARRVVRREAAAPKPPKPLTGLPRYVYRSPAGKFIAQLSKPTTGQNPIYLGLFATVEEAAAAVARALAMREAAE